MFSTKHKVKRYSYLEGFGGLQKLFREYYFFGLKFWSREIDREEVPVWAEIQLNTLGSTEWRSKFAEYI